MDPAEHRDRLIDALLQEELGGDIPPDLTARIMRRLPARPRMIWQQPWAWAALITMILAVTGAWIWRNRYPAPTASGSYNVVGDGVVARSAILATDEQQAVVTLGGYSHVTMAPASRMRIDGSKYAEAVHLMQGEVACSVDRHRGTFDVTTEIGTVSVTGTEFTVRVKEKHEGEQEMKRATTTLLLIVAVTTGSVTVDYQGKTYEISAGAQQVFGDESRRTDTGNSTAVRGFSGMVRGVVEGTGDGHLMFRVARVLKTWKGNKAREPEALVGKTLRLGPRRENIKTGTGKPVPRHLAYIRSLKKGDEINLEIYNPKGREWHILELDGDQRRVADRLLNEREHGDGDKREGDREAQEREGRQREGDREAEERERRRHEEELKIQERERRRHEEERELLERTKGHQEGDREGDEHGEGGLPEGLHGFRGMVEGTIVKKNRDYFVLKVEKVTHVWKANKARNPRGAIGKEIQIDFARKTRLQKKNLMTYRKLRAGDRVSVEPFHFGGNRLSVMEELKRID